MISDVDIVSTVIPDGKTEALAAAAQPGLDQIALVSPQQSLILVTLKNLETHKGVKGRLQTLFISLVGELEGLGQSRLIHRCGGVELIDQIGNVEFHQDRRWYRSSRSGEGVSVGHDGR